MRSWVALIFGMLLGCATAPGSQLRLDRYVAGRLDKVTALAELKYAHWWLSSCDGENLLVVRSDGSASLEVNRDGSFWARREWKLPAARMAELQRRELKDGIDRIPVLDRDAPNRFSDGPPDVLVVRAANGLHLTHRLAQNDPWRDFERDLAFQSDVRSRLGPCGGPPL